MLKVDTARLLQAEMDRKAFLKNAGIAFVGIIGLTAAVRSINGIAGQPKAPVQASAFGYGGSAYGGGHVSR